MSVQQDCMPEFHVSKAGLRTKEMKYSTIIFDFDYTLADATNGIVSSFNYAFNRLDIPECDRESIKKTVGLPLDKSFIHLTNNKNEVLINRFLSFFREKANEVMSKDTVLYADTVNTLQRLKRNGLNTGIVTTKYHFRIVETLNLHGVLDLIDVIVGGEDVKVPKPSPEGLLLAIDSLNEQLNNVLYIGDSLIDARTALAANIDFAAVTTGTTKETEFSQYPYIKIVKNLSELFSE
ncbi:HAD family hydrolase [Methanosarcina sp.]|uniref:HAD family hydrolase n=1 Tax=Methanosarcina sp. TaxID=2213 RepID=UPI003C70C19D